MHAERTSPGFNASAPQSVPVFVAAIAEPLLAVPTFLAVTVLHDEPVNRAVMILCILMLVLVFPGTNRFYERPLNSAVDIVSAWVVVLLILGLCGYATDSLKFFELPVLLWWAGITPLAQFACVMIGRSLMRSHAAQPESRRPALVIGAGALGAKVAQALGSRRSYGHDFIGYVEDRQPERRHPEAADQVVARFDEIVDCIARHRIKDVYITLPLSSQPRIMRMLTALQDTAVSIYFVPDVFGVNVIQGRMRNMDGVPIVSLLESPFVGINGLAKRASDIVLASLILLLVSPLLLAIAIGVKLSSPGPVIFRQRRNGLDGDEIAGHSSAAIVARGLALVPENRLVFPHMTVKENLEAGAYPDVSRIFVPVGCQHCDDPPCMHVCPSTATRRRRCATGRRPWPRAQDLCRRGIARRCQRLSPGVAAIRTPHALDEGGRRERPSPTWRCSGPSSPT